MQRSHEGRISRLVGQSVNSSKQMPESRRMKVRFSRSRTRSHRRALRLSAWRLSVLGGVCVTRGGWSRVWGGLGGFAFVPFRRPTPPRPRAGPVLMVW